MARKAKQPSFSPAESAHLKNLSAQTGGEPTDFDDEMQEHLEDHFAHEANAAKMHAAQAGSSGLGPSSMDTEAVKQRGALQQQSDMAGAQAAMQAQGQQTPVTPPAAPTGPVGTSRPYPAQKCPQGPPQTSAGQSGPMPTTALAPPATPGPQEPPQGPPQMKAKKKDHPHER